MEPIIDWIKKACHGLIRVASWPLWKAKVVWITVLTILGVLFFCYMSARTCIGTWEVRIRYSGLALELLGIGTAAYGLKETAKSFGRNLSSIISELIKGSLKFDDTNNTNNINITRFGFDCHPLITVNSPPTQGAPIEDQVEEQWKILNQMNEQVHKIEHQLTKEIQDRLVALNNERGAREAGVENVRQALEKLAVEGLAIEVRYRLPRIWSFFCHRFTRTGMFF